MMNFNIILNKLFRPFKLIYYNYSFDTRCYPIDKKLNILLIYLENVEIVSIELFTFQCKITFVDNSELTFWNANRWYGWMSSGKMIFSNGKIMEWRSKCPSYETLYKYRKLIKNYEKPKTVEKESNDIVGDFTDCLPIKILRKEKLKKIKK